jgi:hypothetical protein
MTDAMNCGACGMRCAVGQICSGGVCSFPDASTDASTDASADVMADVSSDTGMTDVASVDTGTALAYLLYVAPPSGTAMVSTADPTNLVSMETANRTTLVGHTWLATGTEATPFALAGMPLRVGITPGHAIYKISIGGTYVDMCRDCAVHGRCNAAQLGYRDGDIRVANQPFLSDTGADVNGRIVPVAQVFLRVDPFRTDGTCALIVPIDQPIGSVPSGTRLPP